MTQISFLSFCVLSLLGFSGSASAATELAKINGTSITLEDFEKRYRDNLKYFAFKTPDKKSVLEDLIKRELAIQEAKKLGIDKEPDVIDRVNTVLYQALIDKKLSKDFEKIRITDDEASAYYKRNPELRTSHIFVAVAPDAAPELVKKAKEKITKIQDEQLKGGKMSFAEAAQKFSEGIAAPMGGDIDYQTKNKLDPNYYQTAVNLKTVGRTSDVIRTQFGLHIIKLTAIRPWEETDQGQIKRLLFDEKRNELFESYVSGLRKTAKVSVNSKLLEK
jgi:peptidyl-prolyl cis-trans isomerase C/peptidyl-prolyl cis-trans isomerase D